ncbi:fimbrial protein [Escherichia coli]
MKKTLIALAVAASAAVSGSAFAAASWTPGDFTGNFEMGGQLTPPSQTGNPWSVAVGNKVSDLDATLEAGQKEVTINASENIGILGIHPTKNERFVGQTGIAPQINYGDAVNIDSFANGIGDLSLSVKDQSTDQDIGTLTTKIFAGGVIARYTPDDYGYGEAGVASSLYASVAGKAFYGGVGKTEESIDHSSSGVVSKASAFFSDITDTYVPSPHGDGVWSEETFGPKPNYSFSGLYASGIHSGQAITITLKQALSEATGWKASLPITVSYQ